MSEKSIEVLLSTMQQSNFNIYSKMNIQTDAIIINQADYFDYKEKYIDNNKIRMFTFNERGIGCSRNSALVRANSDICILADDDVVYVADYAEIVLKSFDAHKDADIIIFNVKIVDQRGIRDKVKKNGRVFLFNSLKYGAVSIAFKRKSVEKRNISFSTLFGGGSIYGSGEDSLFIWDCLKNGLKIYTDTNTIATVYNDNSTWFTGYNEKYLFDKGALFMALSSKLWLLFNIQFALKNIKNFKGNIGIFKMIRIMNQGSMNFKFLGK